MRRPAGAGLRRRRLLRGEEGQMAGVEAVPFGFLVFVVGVLIVASAWGVVDAKLAVASAAREATRAYVESPPDTDPDARAYTAARAAVAGAGRDPARLTLTRLEGEFVRCALVRFEAAYPVPAVRIPLLGAWGHGFWAQARHAELVDPYRSGVPRGAAGCGAGG